MSRSQKINIALLLATITVCLYQLSFQFRGQFADGSIESLSKVRAAGSGETLVLVDRRGFKLSEEIIPSLKFYFGLDVMFLSNVNDLVGHLNEGFKELAGKYDSVVVLSQRELKDSLAPISKVESFQFEKGYYKESRDIPDDFRVHKLWMHTYQLDTEKFLADILSPYVFRPVDNKSSVQNFTSQYLWTKECSEIVLRPQSLEYKSLVLRLRGWHPFWRDLERLNLSVTVDGQSAKFVDLMDKGYLFELPEISSESELRICSETFVPRELNMNSDGRSLGLDLLEVRLQSL